MNCPPKRKRPLVCYGGDYNGRLYRPMSRREMRAARMAVSRTRPQPYTHFAARDRRSELFAELASWQGIARRGLHPSERSVIAMHRDNLRAANRLAPTVFR